MAEYHFAPRLTLEQVEVLAKALVPTYAGKPVVLCLSGTGRISNAGYLKNSLGRGCEDIQSGILPLVSTLLQLRWLARGHRTSNRSERCRPRGVCIVSSPAARHVVQV